MGATLTTTTTRDLGRLADRERNPAVVYLTSLPSPASRRAMRGALAKVASLLAGGGTVVDPLAFPWAEVRYQHSQAVRVLLMERSAPATANQALAALRGVLRESWRLGLMDAEAFHRAADLPAVKSSRLPAGREVTRAEVGRLFDACDRGTAAGARDAALLAVLYGVGLRRSEAVALDLSDFDPATGALKVRRGKGRKDRMAYAPQGTRAALSAWLTVRGPEAGPLLSPVLKGGAVLLRRMTAQTVYDALERVRVRAGVAPFSPHDLRRSCISSLLDAGADLVTVQALAGHADPRTTSRYDRRGDRAKERAATLHAVPYA